jgi:hypothetical protein
MAITIKYRKIAGDGVNDRDNILGNIPSLHTGTTTFDNGVTIAWRLGNLPVDPGNLLIYILIRGGLRIRMRYIKENEVVNDRGNKHVHASQI